jgi:hypothetical protein
MYVSGARVAAIIAFDWAGNLHQIDPLAWLCRWVRFSDDLLSPEGMLKTASDLKKPPHYDLAQEAEWVVGFVMGAIDASVEAAKEDLSRLRRAQRPLRAKVKRLAREPWALPAPHQVVV